MLMKVLVTGANGFVAKNLLIHLSERNDIELFTFNRENSLSDLLTILTTVDFVFHLAGVNRPENDAEFIEGNVNLTQALCNAIEQSDNKIPILYTSSIQAELDNPYGRSKLNAERILQDYSNGTGARVYIFRLPNVFGKWSKPNYNSVVSTFCYNIANDLPITVNDPNSQVCLIHVDDVIKEFMAIMDGAPIDTVYCQINPVYETTVGELAKKITAYKHSRQTLVSERVGKGFERALYSTYLSYLKPNQFSYSVDKYDDERGVFIEMLKTKDSGQFSFFTARPGITRGGHYHHTKTEKFLVIKGEALFRFRHIVTEEYYELKTKADSPDIVETVPGWAHDITNIGDDEMIVMLWANEIFDRNNPDTYARKF